MSAPIPPNPCLIAILLVVKSRAGPRFVFHYPLNVGEDVSQSYKAVHDAGQETADISSSDDDLIFSSDEDETLLDGRRWDHTDAQAQRSYKRSRFQEEDEGDSPSSQIEGNGRYGEQSRSKKPAWESVLGFSTDGLGTLLCPLRTFHKRRFEMTLDQLVFVGWPVFVRDDGAWRKMREKRRKKDGVDNSSEDKTGDVLEEGIEHPKRTDLELNEDLEETSGHDTALDEPGSNAITEEVPPQDEKTTATGKRKDSMTMFNVIFVMSPPALEHHLRVKQMYDNVVKKFSRALKWEQARSDYVWKESKQILKLKEKAKESKTPISTLWSQILSQSSLAKAVSTLYSSISRSSIAQIRLSPTLSLSLQIPIPTSTSILPTPTEPQMPGLWLTTATSLPDDPTTETTNLARHFALLLLDDEATILKDIEQSAGELAGPLTHYIRSSTPTKSFAQISTMSNIPLPDIQFLASHLIYWRRARAIPPIHQRDTYIVSPNADLRRLSAAIPLYAATFPTLPSLPKMLSMLSGTPKAYASLIPSKDHKVAYFDILAWLLRGGWVTQLRTFAWVRVPAEVQAAVAAEMKSEAAATDGRASSSSTQQDQQQSEPTPRRRSSTLPSVSKPTDQSPGPGPGPGPADRYPPITFGPPDDQTTTPPSPSPTSSTPSQTFAPLIILDPHKSLALESRYIAYIGTHLLPSLPYVSSSSTKPNTAPSPSPPPQTPPQTQNSPPSAPPPTTNTITITPQDLSTSWSTYVKYFNGQHALEKIATREGVKRKRVEMVLGIMEAGGVLVRARFW